MCLYKYNGLAKFKMSPDKMSEMYKKHGLDIIEASPGDVLSPIPHLYTVLHTIFHLREEW